MTGLRSSSEHRPDAGAVAIAIEDRAAASPLMGKKRSRESYPAAIFLTTLPSLAILTAVLVSVFTHVPMGRWLVDPPSMRLALSQNFISAWIVAAPIPFTAALIEAMYHASKAASETPAEEWSTRDGLEDARARARTTSTAEMLILPTGCVAVVALLLTYFLPTFDWDGTKLWFCLTVILLVALVLLLRVAFLSLREGLVCRERGNALAYFYARAPTLLATIALQCSVFAFVFWEDLYILPVTPTFAHYHPEDTCIDLGSNYTAENCHLVAAGIWTEDWLVNTAIEPLAVGGAVWVCNDEYKSSFDLIYTSTLAACRASALILHMYGRLLGGLPFNIVLLFVVAFREMLVGIDAEITWSNWAARGTGRMKGAIILASIGTLPYLPFYLLSMLVPSVRFFSRRYSTGMILFGFDIICWILAFALLRVEFYFRSYSSSGDLLLHDGSSLKDKLTKIVAELPLAVLTRSDSNEIAAVGHKLTGDVRHLKTGDAADAAKGVNEFMKVGIDFEIGKVGEGVRRIKQEFLEAHKLAQTEHDSAVERGDADEEIEKLRQRLDNAASDMECVLYVEREKAGSSEKTFANGSLKRDCDSSGDVLSDRITARGEGMDLEDFCNHPSARTAKLHVAHVFALRLYTTAAFARVNGPFRDPDPDRPTHPFPITVHYINEGISKLRAVGAKEGGLARLDFWRGMQNVGLDDNKCNFLKDGGTEVAPMSTTKDLSIAVEYSMSRRPLLFRLVTTSFMQRGADLRFLSAFPVEAEYLYQPLTFLRPTGKRIEVEITNKDIQAATEGKRTLRAASLTFTVVEVEPLH